jgi:HK97 family phage prohead protease
MTGKRDVDYKALPGFETKTIPTFVKNVDEARGIVEHIVSVFGIIDSYNDIVMPGSFAKTIVEHGSRVRVLDQHNYYSALNTVGKPLGLREIGRDELPLEVTAQYPEATGGLLATTQYALETDNGRNMFALVSGGFLPETSIGYDALDTEEEIKEIDGDKMAVRLLKTIRLWEYSNVIWGANPATATVSAKSNEPTDGKPVSGATDLPIAARDRPWDASAAMEGMRRVTGSDEEPSASYRNGFFWFDGEATELFGSYKLPFADDVGGEMTAIPRGIFAGAARLDQTDIPDADKARIQSRMSRYYARMREQFDDDSLVPPWEKSAHFRPQVKAVNLTALVDRVIMSFYNQYPDHFGFEQGGNDDVIYWVNAVYDEFVIVRQCGTLEKLWKISYAVMDSRVQFAPREEWIHVEISYVPVMPQGDQVDGDGRTVLEWEGPHGKETAVIPASATVVFNINGQVPVQKTAAPRHGAADDSETKEAGPAMPPTSEVDELRIEILKAKLRDYNTLEVR